MLQRAAWPKIHFPTCESRLDAAPTELIACFSPVTIKILLLRSMPDPTNVQTPTTAEDARATLWRLGEAL